MLSRSLEQPKRPKLDVLPGGTANVKGLLPPGAQSGGPSLNHTLQQIQPQTHRPTTESSAFLPHASRGARVRQGNPASGGGGGAPSSSRTTASEGPSALPYYLMILANRGQRG